MKPDATQEQISHVCGLVREMGLKDQIIVGAELLVEADVTLALVDRERMKPARMPEELQQALLK